MVRLPVIIFLYLSIAHGLPLLGIFDPSQGLDLTLTNDLVSWQGRRHYSILFFTDWCNSPTAVNRVFQQCDNIWSNGSVPIITWEIKPSCQGGYTDVVVEATSGKHDAYLNTWGDRLKQWVSGPDNVFGNDDDRHAFVRMGHEMNGNWYPWSPGGPSTTAATTPQGFVSAWQHVMGIMSAKGIGPKSGRVEWIWCANNFGPNNASDFYPGDQYVDFLSTDGYNNIFWSSTQTPATTFDPIFATFAKLTSLSKSKVMITEWATNTQTQIGGNTIQMKAGWITQAFQYFSKHPEITLVSYFNTDQLTNKNDWQVFGGSMGDASFTSATSGTTYKVYTEFATAALQYTTSTRLDNPGGASPPNPGPIVPGYTSSAAGLSGGAIAVIVAAVAFGAVP